VVVTDGAASGIPDSGGRSCATPLPALAALGFFVMALGINQTVKIKFNFFVGKKHPAVSVQSPDWTAKDLVSSNWNDCQPGARCEVRF
jgi:hypothetical protein